MCNEKEGKFVIITIDGPAGAGKSTVAKKVAHTLGYEYLDTGALYRAIALYLRDKKVPPVESDEMKTALSNVDIHFEKERIYLDGRDVSAEIRTVEIETIVSSYAKLSMVREKLLEIQRKLGSLGNIVADGRDMGTVVFPEAILKIYLNAELKERAKRRWNDIKASGRALSLEEGEDAQGAASALKQLIGLLESGENVLVFPEGSRSLDGKLQPLEEGVAMLSIKTDAPIIPVWVHGSFNALPKHAKMYKPCKIVVNFGEAIHLEDFKNKTASAKELRKMITEELARRLLVLKEEIETC